MRKTILLFAMLLFTFNGSTALEPVRVAFNYSSGGNTDVEVELYDYNTNSTIYTENMGNLTANSSGIITFLVGDGVTAWQNISANSVNGNMVINVKTGSPASLYAQFRLDQLIMVQAQTGTGSALSGGANAVSSLLGNQYKKCINLSLSFLGSVGVGSTPHRISVLENYSYVVDAFNLDLTIINVSDPNNPTVEGSVGINSVPRSLSVSGDYAYVGTDDLLIIIDVSDPNNPSIIGNIGIGPLPRSLSISGDYAYVVDENSDDLKVIDVSDPNNPSIIGNIGIGNSPSSISLQGDFAYVVDIGSNDLKVIDVSDPNNPSITGSVGISYLPVSVSIQRNFAFVMEVGNNELNVIDVSDPNNPTISGSLNIGPNPRSISIQEGFGYLVDVDNGTLKVIEIFNCSDLAFNLQLYNSELRYKQAFWKCKGIDIHTTHKGNVGIRTESPNYTLQVGNSGDGTEARANVWNTFSDRRWKTDIQFITSAIEKLKEINGYYYKWKDKPDTSTQVGVIAQEIEKVLPEVVSTDANGYKSVDYSKLTALLIQAVKEQQQEIENTKQRLDYIESQLGISTGTN